MRNEALAVTAVEWSKASKELKETKKQLNEYKRRCRELEKALAKVKTLILGATEGLNAED